jgi:hypothetical protein
MMFLRGLSKVLVIFPVITFLFDLINGFFVKNKVEFRSLKVWWQAISQDSYPAGREFLRGIFENWDKWADKPACLVLLVPPVVCYVIYRLIFAIRGGRGGGGFNYKSPD